MIRTTINRIRTLRGDTAVHHSTKYPPIPGFQIFLQLTLPPNPLARYIVIDSRAR